jgi:SAM-dependent methyltransferase
VERQPVSASAGAADAPGTGPPSGRSLPDYDHQLSNFHQAFERELETLLLELPLRPEMRVLDLACSDGFYTRRIAERLGSRGSITGVDINLAYLCEAREEASRQNGPRVDLVWGRGPTARETNARQLGLAANCRSRRRKDALRSAEAVGAGTARDAR